MPQAQKATIVLQKTKLSDAVLDQLDKDAIIAPERVSIIPVHRAFAPMVNQSAYDISELAIVTAIQAVEHGKPVVLLPITVAARLQHKCIVQNNRFTSLTPSDLEGKRVAVRAFSQTTGSWVRTILEQEYGVSIPKVTWITEEAPHVREAVEPVHVLRDPNGAGPYELLKEGKVAAAIFGNDMPGDDWVRPVIPDPDIAAMESFEARGIVPINHIVALSRDFANRMPEAAAYLCDLFADTKARVVTDDGLDLLPMGIEAMKPSIEMLLLSAFNQGLTSRRITFDELFGEARKLIGA